MRNRSMSKEQAGFVEALDERGPQVARQDHVLVCIECQSAFTFAVGEQVYFEQHDFQPPKRCKPCRAARKAVRVEQ